MKIAVTGSSGFIGQYVLRELLSLNEVDSIIAMGRHKERPEIIPVECQYKYFDIAHPSPEDYKRIGKPDVMIHLAWEGLPNYSSLHHYETELPRQYHFLKAMVEAGLPSLFVSGTCFEYGMQSGPLDVAMPTKPNNPYGHAKDALRQQLIFLKNVKRFNLVWARLFYMFGEGQSNTSLYSKLKDAVLRQDKVFHMSGGKQLRDYLPIEEVARQIVHAAMVKVDAGTINICSGKPISIRDLVENWIDENNWKIQLNLGFYPYSEHEPMDFWGVNSLSPLINSSKVMTNNNSLVGDNS